MHVTQQLYSAHVYSAHARHDLYSCAAALIQFMHVCHMTHATRRYCTEHTCAECALYCPIPYLEW